MEGEGTFVLPLPRLLSTAPPDKARLVRLTLAAVSCVPFIMVNLKYVLWGPMAPRPVWTAYVVLLSLPLRSGRHCDAEERVTVWLLPLMTETVGLSHVIARPTECWRRQRGCRRDSIRL